MKDDFKKFVLKQILNSKNMKTESIPPALRNLLTKLEYISMIERGQKPCFSDMTFVHSNSWMGAWKRLISGENKKNLLFEIEQIIDRSILAIEEYSNKDYIKLLIENLAKAKIGIENLILTYTEHPETITNLRVHIINIDLTLKKHGYIHPSDQKTPIVDRKIDDRRTEGKSDVRNEMRNEGTKTDTNNPVDDFQRIIDTLGDVKSRMSKSTPLPIVVGDTKQKNKSESFKRFTPKDYIEKHMFTPSSPDKSLSQTDTSDSEHKTDIHTHISNIEANRQQIFPLTERKFGNDILSLNEMSQTPSI